MSVFGEEWWDAKTMTLDGLDTRGEPTIPRLLWIRWRLIDELLRRFYLDVGLEVGFGPLGMELYNDPVWSPNCERAPRYFGRLCANHVHSAINDECPELAPAYLGGAQDYMPENVWPSWSEYLASAIEALGLGEAGVPGHEGCWHRRGKAILPLVFRVALLLRASGVDLRNSRQGMCTYPCHDGEDPCNRDDVAGLDAVFTLLDQRGELAGSRPRGLIVRQNEEPWIAIRADGQVFTRHGDTDVRAMWQAGDGEAAIARRIQSLAQWEKADGEVMPRDEVDRPLKRRSQT
jgi:hypothetical protein